MIRAPRRRGLARSAWLGITAALVLGATLAARPAEASLSDPAAEAARQRGLLQRAADALAALEALETELEPARTAARQGASLVVAGEEPPQPFLEQAAALLTEAGEQADEAVAALRRLEGTAASVRPGLDVPHVLGAGDLSSIAAQLNDAAAEAVPFLERRHAAEDTLERLEAALAALRENEVDRARVALDQARASRATLARWEPEPVTLPLWLSTTRRLIRAADGIAAAAQAGDEQAARAAARRYAAAAEEAHRADVSLALTLSETGSGLTATPMRRLADGLAASARARAAVASLLQSDG
jgi:hypothetical protein